MRAAYVNRRPGRADQSSSARARSDAIRGVLDAVAADVAPAERSFDALARLIADAVLDQDHATLREATNIFRSVPAGAAWRAAHADVARARIRMLAAVAYAAAERMPSSYVRARITPRSRAHAMLRVVAGADTLPTAAVVELAEIDATAVSRVGRALVRDGLLTRTKVGKSVYWDATPLGRIALQQTGEREARAPQGRPSEPVRREAPVEEPMRRHVERVQASLSYAAPSHLYDARQLTPYAFATPQLQETVRRTTDREKLSRLLMLDLVGRRPEELTGRLYSNESFRAFAAGGPIKFAVPPLETDARAWEQSTETIVSTVSVGVRTIREFWPARLPRCDAFAMVEGAGGRPGVVLVEAKSRPEEFRFGRPRVKRADRRRQVRSALAATGSYIGAQRRWDSSGDFPDPASRLALLYFLRDHGVDAWLMNVYFFTSEEKERSPCASVHDWTESIEDVREALAISGGHKLSPYVLQEFVAMPGDLEADRQMSEPSLPSPRRRAAV